MADNDHPLKLAAIAIAGTLSLVTVIVTQWIIPTQTASLSHHIDLLEESLSKQKLDIEALILKQKELSELLDYEKSSHKKDVNEIRANNERLKIRNFTLEMSNAFALSDPYPIEFHKIQLGAQRDDVLKAYPDNAFIGKGRVLSIQNKEGVFRRVSYISLTPDGPVDSIKFSLDRLGRVLEHQEKIPDIWLQETLIRVLGKPFVVGIDENCYMWRPSDNALVYYMVGADSYEISGFHTYPPGCDVSDEQLSKYKKVRAEEQR